MSQRSELLELKTSKKLYRKPLKLDLGCGPRKAGEGFIGIDRLPFPGVDIRLDFERDKLPYSNHSVDYIRAVHVLEHIQNFVPFLNEIWRVLKPDAIFDIVVPNDPEMNCWTDPQHCRKFSKHSFDLFDPNHFLFRESGWFTAIARFKVIKKKYEKNELFFRLSALKKRVCFIAPPSSIHTRRWKDYITQRGLHICVAGRVKKGVGDIALGGTIKNREKSLDEMPYIAKELLEHEDFDVIHLHYPSIYGSVLKLSTNRARFIVSVWGEDVLTEARICSQARNRILDSFRLADFITTTSKHMANILVRDFGILRRKIWVIPWGYNEKFFNDNSEKDDFYLKDLAIPLNSPTFLSARVCRPENNIHRLIPSFLESSICGNLIVLSGDLKNHSYFKECQNNFKNSRIIFLPTIGERELSALYRKSIATISIPTVDQLSTTILESLACGTPVICSNLPVNHERIIHGSNGWIVNDLNSSDLVKIFQQATESMLIREDDIRKNAKQSVSLDNWSTNADFLLQLYDAPLNYDECI